MTLLWLKTFHVFFVISWFAGLFYLPRIFVNLAQVPQAGAERERLLGMATRLKRFMGPLMGGTWLFGLALVYAYGLEWFKHSPWLHAKLVLVIVLSGYDGYCKKLLRDFQNDSNRRSHTWYRWFNEVPALLLLLILILVIVKPF
jgi:putative membrane protein